MKISNLFEIDVKVYIAGVLVPCSNVSITSAFNAVPTATIALPADPRLFGIGRHDRVPVQVFINNGFGSSSSGYILIFDGEINSYGYASTPVGREISINAHASMAFLQDVRIHLLNKLEDYANAVTPGEAISTAGVTSSGLTFPASLFMQGVTQVEAANLIKVPWQFVDNIATYLQAVGDPSFNISSKVGEFYKAFADRLNFKNRYPKLPFYDEAVNNWDVQTQGNARCFPMLSGMQEQAAIGLLAGFVNEQNRGTLLSFLNAIANNMEYEVCFPSAPKFDASEGKLYSLIFKPMFYDAFPPACNILFRSHVDSVRMSERVHGVPTRIRVRDSAGPTAMVSQQQDNYLARVGMLDYWPTTHSADKDTQTNSKENLFAAERLASEEYTGPYLYDTSAPRWFSYLDLRQGEDFAAYKKRMLQHMYTLKRYENRNLQVSTVFNPFVTPGFPAVVFDSWQTSGNDFVFAGQVMAVTHSLSKQGVGTSITLSFCRTLSEELGAGTLEHGLQVIKDVNRDQTRISQIYQKILGCNAVSFESLATKDFGRQHGDPLAAFDYNARSICTMEQFLQFLGTTATQANKSVFAGDYFTRRYLGTLRDTLQDIAAEHSKMSIYA